MTRPGIEPRSPGVLASNLTMISIGRIDQIKDWSYSIVLGDPLPKKTLNNYQNNECTMNAIT